MPAGLSYGNWQPKPLLSRKCCRALNNTAMNNQDCLNVSFIIIKYFFPFFTVISFNNTYFEQSYTLHFTSPSISLQSYKKNKMISAAFENFSEDSYAICAVCSSFCFSLIFSYSIFLFFVSASAVVVNNCTSALELCLLVHSIIHDHLCFASNRYCHSPMQACIRIVVMELRRENLIGLRNLYI